ncbi:integrase core domain-containing protein [Mycolicibacterium tokaiense]|uniref:integrase core domain-containing protein n=1 Tax=Mycolicibacterium tokaiense TaxID=39695 RepID=UPI003F4995FE
MHPGSSSTTLNAATAHSTGYHRSADCDQPDGRVHHRAQALAPWVEFYNTQRRHSALDGLPPISRLRPT